MSRSHPALSLRAAEVIVLLHAAAPAWCRKSRKATARAVTAGPDRSWSCRDAMRWQPDATPNGTPCLARRHWVAPAVPSLGRHGLGSPVLDPRPRSLTPMSGSAMDASKLPRRPKRRFVFVERDPDWPAIDSAERQGDWGHLANGRRLRPSLVMGWEARQQPVQDAAEIKQMRRRSSRVCAARYVTWRRTCKTQKAQNSRGQARFPAKISREGTCGAPIKLLLSEKHRTRRQSARDSDFRKGRNSLASWDCGNDTRASCGKKERNGPP